MHIFSTSLLLGSSLLLALNFLVVCNEALVVTVSNGLLNGTNGVSRLGREFYSFYGIPYAKPPIGSLRFEPPQPSEDWSDVRDASNYGNVCIQSGDRGSEDCLYLNVFSPKIGSNFSDTPLPVIFYIHGGGFSGGQSNGNDPDYFMDEDVILVTTNYRVHSIGFLNTNDGLIRGNMGLKDLTASLKWVQENIHVFGGDPEKVTIFGHSAGSAAVSYLMLSPTTKGLFAKAIGRSGVATKIWSFQAKPEEQALLLAQRLNCPLENRTEMVNCLKNADAREITRLSNMGGGALKYDLDVFLPSIEVNSPDAFLAKHPYDVLQAGEAHKVPWISGSNSGDGSLYIDGLKDNQQLKAQINANWTTEMASKYLYYDKSFTNVTARVNEFYFGESNPVIDLDSMFDKFKELWTDRYYGAFTWNTGMMQARNAPVYFYYNDFNMRLLSNIKVVNHGAEMGLYFPSDSWFIRPDSPYYTISRDLVALWAQFATTNGTELNFQGNIWTPINPDEPVKFLLFTDDRPSTIVQEPTRDRMLLWDSLDLYRIGKYDA